MYSLVKVLCARGQRNPDREIMSSKPIEGDRTLAYCTGSLNLNLHCRNDSIGTQVIRPHSNRRLGIGPGGITLMMN